MSSDVNYCRMELEGNIGTNYSGYKQLAEFYCRCLDHKGEHIHIDMSNVAWFDGNLCALLLAIVHKLFHENGNTFSTDETDIKERFEVFYRNGFLSNGDITTDTRKSTVPVRAFECNDKEGFVQYVENDLLMHRGLGAMDQVLKERICDDLLEVFCNTHQHANTSYPFFVAGQYFPRLGLLKFTMVDLGEGFLKKIARATGNRISDNVSAIKWAVDGNSTKKVLLGCPGGLGLSSMHRYCLGNKGVLQIVSNDGFWSSELEGTIFHRGRTFPNPFVGTTINLFFKN